MIVWGGSLGGPGEEKTDTGGIYDPATDTWTPMSTAGAPGGRILFTAVWARSRMIVWGGLQSDGITRTGGLYDPTTDTWVATTLSGAPSEREFHTAVWTGSRMVVWGGVGPGLVTTNTGAAYDPVADAWTPTVVTGAPVARFDHSAVWTGSRMIVWGGREPPSTPDTEKDTGGIYDDPSLLGPPQSFYTVAPCRLVDTRSPVGPAGGPALGGNATRTFTVTGAACGVPSTALAVSVNVTAVGAAANGNLALFPGDGPGPPVASTLNFAAGVTRANNAVVTLAADGTGTVKVKNRSTGTVHFVLDVNGYFQ
jgi:hypothetical protein